MTYADRASRYLHSLLFPTMQDAQWKFHLTTRRGAYLVREISRLSREFAEVARDTAEEKPGY